MLGTVLLIVLILLVVGGLPQLSGGWHGLGYAPSTLSLVLVILLIVLLLGGRI